METFQLTSLRADCPGVHMGNRRLNRYGGFRLSTDVLIQRRHLKNNHIVAYVNQSERPGIKNAGFKDSRIQGFKGSRGRDQGPGVSSQGSGIRVKD